MAVHGNLGEEVPVFDDVLLFHDQEIFPFTSPDENCKVFKFQTDRHYYVVLRQRYLAVKLNFVTGHG